MHWQGPSPPPAASGSDLWEEVAIAADMGDDAGGLIERGLKCPLSSRSPQLARISFLFWVIVLVAPLVSLPPSHQPLGIFLTNLTLLLPIVSYDPKGLWD